MATAQEHRNAERALQAQVVRATGDITTQAEFVNFLDSAEGQTAMNEAELTQAERDALYSSDTTTEAVIQGKISAIKKLLKKIPGIIAAAKRGYEKFKTWYEDHVPKYIRYAIKWFWELYKAWTWLKGL
jgi:hypothetical protein